MTNITVGLPVYNGAEFIERAVDSVLAQTYKGWDLIVSDHSSTDGTWEKLQAYRDHPQITLTRIPAGGGAVANWNAVSQLATRPYFKLLCADDTLLPTCLERQEAELTAHPEAVMVAARRRVIDPAGETLIPARGLGPLRGLVPGDRAVRSLIVWGANLLGEPSSTLIRREALEAVGYWKNDFPYLLDQTTYMHMLQHGALYALPEVLATFRISGGQSTVHHQSTAYAQMQGAARWALEAGIISKRAYWVGLAAARKTVAERALAYRIWGRRLADTA